MSKKKNPPHEPLANENDIVWRDRKRTTFLGLPWTFTVYRLTSDRLLIKRGFFTTLEDEVRLYRIVDLSLRRTLIQKMFGIGSILCNSSDKTMGNFEIKNIRKSKNVKALLSDLIEKERMAKRVSSREFMANADSDDEHFDDDHDNDDDNH